jgi:5-methylcytosine-specific restriction endonuclease McrA
MRIIKIIKFLAKSEHQHFISVDIKTYKRWKPIIKLAVRFNKNYKACEIHRKRFKNIENFVVVGLKYSGKKVKRRTSGFAKNFVDMNKGATCIYCEGELDHSNATADHIVPISNGGNNCQVNLIVCCKDCNAERGNSEFKSFLFRKNKKYKRGNIII